jgi:hypothetical protein
MKKPTITLATTGVSDNSDNTGRSLSEALILASTNPQYDKILFIDLPVQYIEIMLRTQIVQNVKTKTKNNLFTQHELNL